MEKETVTCPKCGNSYYRGSACWYCKKTQESPQAPAKEIISKLLPPGNFDAYMHIYQAIREVLEAYPPKAPDIDIIRDNSKGLKKAWRKGYLSYSDALDLQKNFMEKIRTRMLSPSTALYYLLGFNKKGAQADDLAASLLISAIMTDLRLWYKLRRRNEQYGTRAALVSRFLKEEKIVELEPEAVEGRYKRFKLQHISPLLAICKYHLSSQGRSLAEDCPKNSIGFVTLLYRDV